MKQLPKYPIFPRGGGRKNPVMSVREDGLGALPPPNFSSNSGRRYINYRKGLLINIYDLLSKYGNMGDKDKFIKDCLNDDDINELLNNQMVERLDDMGGIPKLLLTIWSKYISHSYLI